MEVNRRQFVVLTSALFVGCDGKQNRAQTTTAPTPTSASVQPQENAVDAGLLSKFRADGVYDSHRERGFFLIHRDNRLFALSSICTHKRCKVRVADDQSFYCKCHGSKFDREGKVIKGPAKRDLPRLAVALGNEDHVIVNLDEKTLAGT